ncbi:TIGR02444 family protein [Marinospirillum perlucidum]|uniref:TIGR02444 family protein n=1 Tax=Marinospirillum perlucidum TaxID=1982602 RepID=UPI000DF18E1A|nr:TIGR02444 family protein [Marinospirillum perlucidum]
MLLHDNPFWRFSLSLYQLKRIKDACLHLQDEGGANVNLLFFALWVSQQQLRFSPDWKTTFQQLENWHRDYTLPLRRQRDELKLLAERADRSENGPLHQMREHLLKAELLSEQQEQAVLYYYYQERQGLIPCEDKQAALIENLTHCISDPTHIDNEPLKVLLGIILEEEQVEVACVQLREQIEKRFLRQN